MVFICFLRARVPRLQVCIVSWMVFIGSRVFILEIRIVFSWGIFRTRVPRLHVCIVLIYFYWNTCSPTGNLYCFSCIFRRCVPKLHVCIVFTDFCRSTCSRSTCFFTERLFRLRWEFFWSTCSHIGFLEGRFSEHLFSYLKFVSF